MCRCPNNAPTKEFLLDALSLRDRRDEGRIGTHGLAVARGRLEKRLDRLLDCRPSHEGNSRPTSRPCPTPAARTYHLTLQAAKQILKSNRTH